MTASVKASANGISRLSSIRESLLSSVGPEVWNFANSLTVRFARTKERCLNQNESSRSFKRVRQSFYDLVLKADVGVVDVAFTRKQDKTAQIQKLSAQKDRELKQLDDEFKEVLKDVQ